MEDRDELKEMYPQRKDFIDNEEWERYERDKGTGGGTFEMKPREHDDFDSAMKRLGQKFLKKLKGFYE